MYSCHSILECCGLFSGVKLSIRLFILFMNPTAYGILSFLSYRGGGGGGLFGPHPRKQVRIV